MPYNILPINLDDLIKARSVECIRIEYKGTWDDNTKKSTLKCVCAFANDIANLNGGYIILGVEAVNGVPILPPKGLPKASLDKIQQEIRVSCKNIDPEYQPVIAPETYQDRDILVLWVPGGDNRPYKAPNERNPKERVYYVRQGSECVIAQDETLRQLIELTQRTPFDDRRNQEAKVLALSPILVKRFLTEVQSDLLNANPPLADEELYKALRIVHPIHDYFVPKNIGLMFFNEHPDEWFIGAKFEVVQFADDAGGNLIEEKNFLGPLNIQIESVLEYLNNLTNIQLLKIPGRAQVERTVAYPYEALEEAIVNASYHRSYETPEPNKVYLYPNRIEIISYPGPVSGISLGDLAGTSPVPPVPARNRRIGQFLKELRLAEMRGTGIPKIRRSMENNGSPSPTIDFDEGRTFFRVILPAHPQYEIVHSLRESSYLWSIGEKKSAIDRLKVVVTKNPESGSITGQLIDLLTLDNQWNEADEVFNKFHSLTTKVETVQPYLSYFRALMGRRDDNAKAQKVMESLDEEAWMERPYDVAVAFKRLGLTSQAHIIMTKIYRDFLTNAEFIHNYGRVKADIANDLYHSPEKNWATIRRLRAEASELFRRAIDLYGNDAQKAWSWYELARILQFSRAPVSKVQEAYENAINTRPDEPRFKDAYQKWKEYIGQKTVTMNDP